MLVPFRLKYFQPSDRSNATQKSSEARDPQGKGITRSQFFMGEQNVYEKMSKWFLRQLDTLRDNCGFPLIINSSFRTSQHHGGIYQKLCKPPPKGSMHLKGRAVDIKISHLTGEQRVKLMQEALALGLSVGVYKNIFHIDDRQHQTIFGNKL